MDFNYKFSAERIGKNIKRRLKDLDMMQNELAEKAGITESAVSYYIAGRRRPNIKALVNMARVLNTTTDYLIFRE